MTKLLLLATTLAACTTVDSDNILTSGIYADIAATATGDGTTTVSATLFLEDPLSLNFVELTGDDQLIATYVGGEDKLMSETEVLNIVSYHATFQTDLEGDEFVVSFVRTVDDGAPESTATLPAELDVLPPPSTSSRAAELALDWDPISTDLMSWSASGDCIDSRFEELDADNGGVTIPAGTFVKRQGNQVPDSCTVTLTIRRERLGTLDRGYGEGGHVAGRQERTITFTSTP